MKSTLNIHWKDWCWNSNTLATSCEELTHWKRPWRWERLMAGGEGDDRGWDNWMASPTQWTWVWVNSGSWWWTGKCCSSWGCKGLDTTEQLNWTEQTQQNSMSSKNKNWLLCFFFNAPEANGVIIVKLNSQEDRFALRNKSLKAP